MRQTFTLFPLMKGIHHGFPAHRLPAGYSPRDRNVRFRDGSITKRPGTLAMTDTFQDTANNFDPNGADGNTSTAAGTITGIFYYIQENGTRDTIIFTGGAAAANRRIYRRGGSRWETLGDGDLTGGVASDDLANTASHLWDAAVAPNSTQTDVFYACAPHQTTTNSGLIKWTGSGTATGLATGGAGPPGVPKYLATFANRLFMGNIYVSGENRANRIAWSKYGDAEVWNTADAGSAELIETPDPITRLMTLRGNLVFYKEQSIYIGTETGISTVPVGVQLASRNIGTAYGYSVASAGDRHFFVGPDNVYMFDGATPTPVGDPIRRNLSDINANSADNVFGVVDFATSEYWLFVPEGDNSYASAAWVYNYKDNTWTRWEFPFYITAAGRAIISAAPSWDNLRAGSGSSTPEHPMYDKAWSEISDATTWSSLLIGGTPTHALANSDKTMEEVNASTSNDASAAIDTWWESPDLDLLGAPGVSASSQYKLLSRVHVMCRASGSSNTLECKVSDDAGTAFTATSTATVPSTGGVITFDVWKTAQKFRIRLGNQTAGQSMPQIEELTLEYEPQDFR